MQRLRSTERVCVTRRARGVQRVRGAFWAACAVGGTLRCVQFYIPRLENMREVLGLIEYDIQR